MWVVQELQRVSRKANFVDINSCWYHLCICMSCIARVSPALNISCSCSHLEYFCQPICNAPSAVPVQQCAAALQGLPSSP